MKFGDKIILKTRTILPKSKTKPSIALWTLKDGDIKLNLEYKHKDVIYIGIWERNINWHVIWNLDDDILQIVNKIHLSK